MSNCFPVQFQCGDTLINRCWDCVAGQALYICQLKDNLEDLQDARDELRALKNDVMRRIINEEGPQMKRLERVQEWVSKVEAILMEVDELIKDGPQEKEKLCLGGCCSKNCKSSYIFGKRISKRLKHVLALKQNGVFEVVVERAAEEPLYIIQLQSNLEALQTEREELWALKEDVMRRVSMEEGQGKKRLEQVQVWLSMVETTITEVDVLIRDSPQEIEKLGLGDFYSSIFVGRVAKKLQDMVALNGKGDFKEVAVRTLPEPVVERPSQQTVGLETVLAEVWSCIVEEEQVGILGLYGMGGVGKTTLLTQINNKYLNTPHDFDVVIWIEVSKDLQLEQVQADIGSRIGFFDELWIKKSFSEKATDICRVLRKKKYVLLLDDIWEQIDVIKLGVPLPNTENGSKLVFTTRSKEVCGYMGADKKIEVGCLAWEKAWDLFYRSVGQHTLNIHLDIPQLAKVVAKECKGLPLALITVGRAMASKETLQQWDHAVRILKNSASKFSGIEKVFYTLKFSYDSLPDDKVRSCFLYFTLFPEDKKVLKTDLIDYWIYEGFFDEYGDISEAQNWGYEIIGTLLHACLLQEGGHYVKMHDMIRDMALWVACEHEKEKENFFVEAGAQLVEVPMAIKWQGVRRMSLMANQIENLTGTPRCPNLLTLFLSQNSLKTISGSFFQFMPNLRVLDLSGNSDLTRLPFGISKLVSLEYLNLVWTGITQLPIELKFLVKLKYLNLDHTYELNTIPWSVISSLSMLRVLRMFEYGGYGARAVLGARDRVVEVETLAGDNESLVEQLKCLKYLEKLYMTIKSYAALQRLLSSLKLQSCVQALSLQFLIDSKSINISFLENMKFLEVFWVIDCNSLEELKIDLIKIGKDFLHAPNRSLHMNDRCFKSICKVNIESCCTLMDLTWLVLAPNLKFLNVVKCTKMEEIISVQKLGELTELVESAKLFAKLEFLKLRFLPRLKSIYRRALQFSHLKEIFVRVCPKLTRLPLNSDSGKENKFVIEGEDHWWQALEWEDEATQQVLLPCFKPLM